MKEQAFKEAMVSMGMTTVINKDDNLEFHYNNPESQPSLKSFTLKQFHPKKKLLFFIKINKANQPKPQPPTTTLQPTL
jgi:hypothetical protein